LTKPVKFPQLLADAVNIRMINQ